MPGSESSTSLSSSLERIRRLSDPRTRRTSGRYVAEGIRNLIEAHDAGVAIEELVVSSRLLTSVAGQKIVRLQRRAGTPCLRVTPEQFRSFSRAEHASGVGFVLRQPWEKLRCIEVDPSSIWLAVSEVAKPGNLGTILRTAEAVGARGLMVIGDRVDPFDPAVVRGSMGAIFHQRFLRTRLRDLRRWAGASGVQIIGAVPRAPRRFDEVATAGPLVLLLGSERKGLDPDEKRICDELVRLPMRGHVDSLNLGVAAGVLLYEVYRQRGFDEPDDTKLACRHPGSVR